MAPPISLPPPSQRLEIDIPANLQVAYANLARIAHAPAEFVLDFARFLPGDAKAIVTARVVMSPVGVKLFAQALAENVARYEATFGPIKLPSTGPSLADTLFGSIQPPQPPEHPDK
ncbi:MAG: DUF3467 domain-containing protein [Anaerolineales bacterium]|nr:DUF3467 domain-containing protein [Anaerolineales bacterium]MCX7609620.1 DUF3467 domain-containing protein [Anaerolineales bacterium]MDW8226437.1 DUF3467 domain-containing protein [Anaerolineales bacterium]